MRTNLLMAIRDIPKRRGSVIILASILIGLILAHFIMISPLAAITVLLLGTALAVTIFLRKVDFLILCWFLLTGLILFILRLLPAHYVPFVGRGIFWGLLVCAIAAWAVDKILSGRRFTSFDNVPLKATVLIFLLWCTVTVFTSIDILNSVKKLSHIVIAFFTSYMFYDFFSRDQNNIRKVLKIVSLVVILVSFMTVASAIQSVISGVPIYKRLSLWFWNPNSLGMLLFICTPILIAAGLDFVSRGVKFFFVSIMLLALFFSFSRASWLGALVSIAFLLWKGWMKMPMSIAIITGLFLAALLFPVIGENVYDFITGEQYTGRKEIWRAAWNTACDYPVLGTGLGTSWTAISKYIDSIWFRGQDTHSVYLKNAAEMGFVSVAILLAFYAIFLYSSEQIEKNLKSDYLRLVTRGATATFLGLFVHGIFENGYVLTAFDASEFTVMFPYILMALPFAAKRLEEKAGD